MADKQSVNMYAVENVCDKYAYPNVAALSRGNEIGKDTIQAVRIKTKFNIDRWKIRKPYKNFNIKLQKNNY